MSNNHRNAQAVVPTPPSGAYLGAYVNPPGATNPPQSLLEAETEALEASPPTHPTLTMHLQYRSWSQLASESPVLDPGLQGDISHNRVPVISWSCSDDIRQNNGHNLNLVEIAAGLGDQDIRQIAKNLAALTSVHGANYPVHVRYFWEFNINASQPGPDFSNIDYLQNDGCFLPVNAATNVPSMPNAPLLNVQFINAWVHIWNVFASTYAGMNPRPNVSFVWNPNVVSSPNVGPVYVDAASFYPGNSFVDWIAADGYNKLDTTSGSPVGFDAVFNGFYVEYTNTSLYSAKPLMIGETASCANLAAPNDQATYLTTILNRLQTNYSAIKAVDYFDDETDYNNKKPGCSWALDPAGITAFANMANNPFFVQSIPGTY